MSSACGDAERLVLVPGFGSESRDCEDGLVRGAEPSRYQVCREVAALKFRPCSPSAAQGMKTLRARIMRDIPRPASGRFKFRIPSRAALVKVPSSRLIRENTGRDWMLQPVAHTDFTGSGIVILQGASRARMCFRVFDNHPKRRTMKLRATEPRRDSPADARCTSAARALACMDAAGGVDEDGHVWQADGGAHEAAVEHSKRLNIA